MAANQASIRVLLLTLAVSLTGCEKPAETPMKIERRRDFTPVEFGIGRLHTANGTCNREIDQLLDATRLCFNSRPETECNRLQEANAQSIARIKGTARCRRPTR